MADWYSDPAKLRNKAAWMDTQALSSIHGNIADAWRGKARALRSRAEIIAAKEALDG